MQHQRNIQISVCIPTYNYAKYLPQAIESVCMQSFKDFELLIFDDCSTDNTSDIIQKYAAGDRRIRFLTNKSRLGMVENWNACLSEARGKYVKFVFGDDLLLSKDALVQMIVKFVSCPDLSLVCCARKIIDADSRELKLESPFRQDLMAEGHTLIRFCLERQSNLVGEPTAVMFRREDARTGFRTQYRQLVDQEMWFRMLEKGSFAYICEPLVAFRRHPLQQSIQNRNRPLEMLDEVAKINERYLDNQYVQISRFFQAYIQWDESYRFWRLYKTRQITRDSAIQEIDQRYGYKKFVVCYPLYKAVKPCLKLCRAIRPIESSIGRKR